VTKKEREEKRQNDRRVQQNKYGEKDEGEGDNERERNICDSIRQTEREQTF
jgi:hypothetical protein